MRAVSKALREYEANMLKWAKRGVAETILIIYSEAVARAATDSGYLKESIDYKMFDGGLSGVVSVGADYAIYVEFGTGIYATRGSSAKKIPWVYKNAWGEFVTTYGSPAQPFWLPAMDAGEAYFKSYFS